MTDLVTQPAVAQPPAADTGMGLFHTRTRANKGIELPLYTPTGESTPYWVRVLGVDSDEFRLAEAESKRDVMRIAQIENLRERSREVELAKVRLVAVLVVGWNFEKEFSTANVIEFLQEAPQIADAIDRVASKRSLFFAAKSSSSPVTQSTSSGST